MIESEVSGVLPVTQIKSADWCIAKHLDPFNIEVYCQNKSLLLHKLCYSLHKHVLMSNKVYERKKGLFNPCQKRGGGIFGKLKASVWSSLSKSRKLSSLIRSFWSAEPGSVSAKIMENFHKYQPKSLEYHTFFSKTYV